MSNPANPEAQASASENNAAAEQTFEQQVNSVAKQLVQDDAGIWQLPEGLEIDESVKYAAMLEKRRRDTESALGKSRQQLKAEENMRKELEKRVAAQVRIEMTPEEQSELESLKYDDPDAWRVKMNELERKASTTLHEELSTMQSSASQQAELERRAQVLSDFNAAHPDAPISDESLANDIPPRIVKKLEDGKVTFEEFLEESYKFLTTPKTVKDTKLAAQPNLGSAGGGANPSDEAIAAQSINSYQNTVF